MELNKIKQYRTELGTFYHNRCEDVLAALPPNSVDMLLTDPPYGINFTGRSMERDHREDSITNDKYWYQTEILLDNVLPLMKRVMKENSEWFIFAPGYTKNGALFKIRDKLKEYVDIAGLLIWDKIFYGLGHDFRNQYESIFHVKFGEGLKRVTNQGTIIKHRRVSVKKDDHPAKKPVGLMAKLIKLKQPGIVLDPFAGTAPVLLAAERLGIKWIGCEINEKWFKVGKNLLAGGSTLIPV